MGRIPHRPGSPWTGILLAASVLGSCLQPAPAQTPVTTTPPSTVQIRSPTSPVLSTVDLHVSEILPKPTVTPGQIQVLENWTFTLTCNGSPSADTVLWLRDEVSLVPSERLVLSSDNRTLTVMGVTRGDAGAYQCEVGNPVSTNRSEPSTVTLAYGPDSTRIDPPGPINLTFGSLLTLTCVADSVPAPSYRWVLNGTDTKETRSSLTFNLTTWAQQGTYECRAHNPVTGRTAWASVAVRVTGTDSRCRNETPRENGAPVPVYVNQSITAWTGPVAQPENPPDPSPMYQTLEPREPDVYEELN
ncbi:carcinoembryonic antigen-related cell adhesion molecule 20 isoform X2 [Chrysemys picta bellii]|uniref:carcinoembryonic antigen-related cell adhesion molecule 20 isoform X2 n=1 Tax=Chrysemys picta bellii TaxID=8478 RepID=UPI0032B30CDF